MDLKPGIRMKEWKRHLFPLAFLVVITASAGFVSTALADVGIDIRSGGVLLEGQEEAAFVAERRGVKIGIEPHAQYSRTPEGLDRIYNLVKIGYFSDMAIYRVVKDFVVQFGIHKDPEVNAVWRKATMPDEMVKQSNTKGMLTFARSGPDSRTTQLFINLAENNSLDKQRCWHRCLEVATGYTHVGKAQVCGKCAIGPCSFESAV